MTASRRATKRSTRHWAGTKEATSYLMASFQRRGAIEAFGMAQKQALLVSQENESLWRTQ